MPVLLVAVLSTASLVVDPPTARAESTIDTIAIDGRLDDDAWAEAPEQELGHQKLPHYDDRPRQPTRFQVLVGPSALVLGIRCEPAVDLRRAALARLMARDDLFDQGPWCTPKTA